MNQPKKISETIVFLEVKPNLDHIVTTNPGLSLLVINVNKGQDF